MFLRVAWLVMRKDLTVEVRSREILYTTAFFAVSCVLVFAFALVKEGRPLEDAAAGILWIAVAFSGTLALGRTFERERHAETLRALMLAPAAAGRHLRRQAARDRAAAARRRGRCWFRSWPCCSRRRSDRASAALAALLVSGTVGLRLGRDAVRRDARARPEPRRPAADPVVPDHDSGDHRGRPGNGGAVRDAAGGRHGRHVDRAAGCSSTWCSSRCPCGPSNR